MIVTESSISCHFCKIGYRGALPPKQVLSICSRSKSRISHWVLVCTMRRFSRCIFFSGRRRNLSLLIAKHQSWEIRNISEIPGLFGGMRLGLGRLKDEQSRIN